MAIDRSGKARTMTKSRPSVRPTATTWAAYAACLWAFAFAALSFYWAAGGEVGIRTIARDVDEVALASEPLIVAGTGVLKVLAGLLALALVQRWGAFIPRRLLLVATWGAAAVLLLYGGASLVQHGLMLADVVSTPEVLGERAVRWHFFLWDPVWLLGGALFAAAAWYYQRQA
jgi:hypothetical protein